MQGIVSAVEVEARLNQKISMITKVRKHVSFGLLVASGFILVISVFFFVRFEFYPTYDVWKNGVEVFIASGEIRGNYGSYSILFFVMFSMLAFSGFSLTKPKGTVFIALVSSITSALLLNGAFLWTAGFITYDIPFYNFSGVDYFMLSMFITFGISILYLTRSIAKGILFTSLILLPLGIEIAISSHAQLWTHVTNAQVGTPLVFFSNFDFLISCILGLALSAGYLVVRAVAYHS